MGVYRLSFFVVLIAILMVYLYSPQLHSMIPDCVENAFENIPDAILGLFQEEKIIGAQVKKKDDPKPEIFPTKSSLPHIFTKDELWNHYRGEKESKGLYLAFFGKVYDVSKGKQYYEPGGGYHFFSGRDGTRGFVTGDFTDKGLTDDLSGLDQSMYGGFEEWIKFYDETYVFKGYLVGNFYDEKGKPTPALRQAHKKMEAAKLAQDRAKEDHKKYPSCNSESSAKGSRVWCSNKSGGIARDWVGVPRLYHTPGGKSARCACIRNTGPPTDGPDTNADRGDLDNPLMKEYPDCPPNSSTCVTSKPKQ